MRAPSHIINEVSSAVDGTAEAMVGVKVGEWVDSPWAHREFSGRW